MKYTFMLDYLLPPWCSIALAVSQRSWETLQKVSTCTTVWLFSCTRDIQSPPLFRALSPSPIAVVITSTTESDTCTSIMGFNHHYCLRVVKSLRMIALPPKLGVITIILTFAISKNRCASAIGMFYLVMVITGVPLFRNAAHGCYSMHTFHTVASLVDSLVSFVCYLKVRLWCS